VAELDLLRLSLVGCDALLTTRTGGVSEGPYGSLNLGLHVGDEPARVLENRARAAAALRAGLDELVFMDQVHGSHVAVVGPAEAGRGALDAADAIEATDALVTTSRQIVLVVLVADCAPIVLCDPVAGVLGVAHAGWRGTVAGVAARTVEAMVRLGARREDLTAIVGPAISPGAYEVGPEVAEAFVEAGAAPAVHDHHGRLHVDLAGANALSLLYAGLAPEHIELTAETSDEPRFFSHRAEQPCGRFGLLARLR
jgi:polyphenol oxidase